MFNILFEIAKVTCIVSVFIAFIGLVLPTLFLYLATVCATLSGILSNYSKFGPVLSFVFSGLSIFFNSAYEASEDLRADFKLLNDEIIESTIALAESSDDDSDALGKPNVFSNQDKPFMTVPSAMVSDVICSKKPE